MDTMRAYRILAGTVALVAALAGGAASAQDFGAGLSAYNRGEYQQAMRNWRPLAEKGDARAQAGIGYLFLRGLGTDVDTDAAKSWYEKAAAQGQAEAQLMLGVMYFFGQGVPRDFVWSYAWCEMAFINGSPEALDCRDASTDSMSDAQLRESFRLVQVLRDRQKQHQESAGR